MVDVKYYYFEPEPAVLSIKTSSTRLFVSLQKLRGVDKPSVHSELDRLRRGSCPLSLEIERKRQSIWAILSKLSEYCTRSCCSLDFSTSLRRETQHWGYSQEPRIWEKLSLRTYSKLSISSHTLRRYPNYIPAEFQSRETNRYFYVIRDPIVDFRILFFSRVTLQKPWGVLIL